MPRQKFRTWPHAGQRRQIALCAGAGVLSAACALGASAANLRANTPIPGGAETAVPIYLTPNTGDQIASMQFRLQYDTARFSVAHVDAGAAANNAGKSVVFAEHDGSATIIIAGLNQDAMNGGLVATVYLSPLGSDSIPQDLGIGGAVFSDPGGNAVAFNELPPKSEPGSTDSNPEKSPPPSTDNGGGETPAPTTDGGTPTPSPTPGASGANNRNYYPDYTGAGGGLRSTTENAAYTGANTANAAAAHNNNTATGVPIPMGGAPGGNMAQGTGSMDNAGYAPSPIPGGPLTNSPARANHRPGSPVAPRTGAGGASPLPGEGARKQDGRTKIAALATPPLSGDDGIALAARSPRGAAAAGADGGTALSADAGYAIPAALLGVLGLAGGTGFIFWRRKAGARR